jgi:hypothetical protein
LWTLDAQDLVPGIHELFTQFGEHNLNRLGGLVTQAPGQASVQIASIKTPHLTMGQMMSDTTIPLGGSTATTTAPTQTPSATSVVTSANDASAEFAECAALCVSIFGALGAVGRFINDLLKKYNADLNALNSAQALVLESGPPRDAPPPPNPDQGFAFGGGTSVPDPDPKNSANIAATKRANDLLDYLHAFGIAMNFPPGYATNPSLKVDETTRRLATPNNFKEWQSQLTNTTDRIKNFSTVESTKASGTLKSGSAMIEEATSLIKNQNSMGQTVSTNLKS